MQKRYIVRLTEEEREICRDVIRADLCCMAF